MSARRSADEGASAHSAWLRAAALAALIASIGDGLLLYVANAQRPELALPPIADSWRIVGGGLGVVAIPVYALGYREAACAVAAASPLAGRVARWAGLVGAGLGAVIHGLTAALIGTAVAAGEPGVDPLAAVAASGPLLPALWIAAALAVAAASAAIAWPIARGRTALPRLVALANPALLTVAIGVAGLPWLAARAFLVPAAPNLAHVVFFAAFSWACRGSKRP